MSNTISWIGTFVPMLSVMDHRLITTHAFPMPDQASFYSGEALLTTWTYDADTGIATRYVTATDDGADLTVTTWDLTSENTFSNAYLAMVTLSADLALWARSY